jgi:hypothetical protein
VFRAELILMLAEGVPFATIQERPQTSAPAVSQWKQRFLGDGLERLDTCHPGQRALRAKILRGGTPKAQGWFDALELCNGPPAGTDEFRKRR